jgi:hypothetical protein
LPERLFVDPVDAVVHEQVRPRHIDLELDDGGAAGRNQRRLNVRFKGSGDAGFAVDAVEDLSDDRTRPA